MKWKRCSLSRVAGSPLLTSKTSSSLFVPGWSSWTSLLRMCSGLFHMSQSSISQVPSVTLHNCPQYLTLCVLLCAPFSEDKMHSSRDFHILFVPRRSMLCEQRLKEQGVLGSFINIDEYILDLIPYDGDLLSMEYESAFRVCSTCTSTDIQLGP